MISSLIKISLTSFFVLWISLSRKRSMNSSCWSRVCFYLRFLFTFPNTLQFHHCRCSWQLLKLSLIKRSGPLLSGSHASSITSLQPSSLIHMALKKNIFLTGLRCCHRLRKSISRQWSNIDIAKWWTPTSGNFSIQLSLATILSSLSLVRCSPYLPLHQLYLCPTKPKSIRPHLLKHSLNSLICPASLPPPPLIIHQNG